MRDEIAIRFRVVDSAGVPVEDAYVTVLWSLTDNPVPEFSKMTDVNGTVRLWLPKGRFVIGANDGERRGEVELEHTGEEPDRVVVLPIRLAR